MSSFLVVPWLNELLLLSPCLLLTLTGKPERPWSLSSLETWSCLCQARARLLWPTEQKTRVGAFLPEPDLPVCPALLQGLHLGWGWVSLALLPPDLGAVLGH